MLGSIAAGLGGNIRDIALSRALSLTPFIGFIGKTAFLTSRRVVRTFESKVTNTSAQYTDHSVILGKPVPEFTGQQLEDISFEITLHGGHGIEPLTDVEQIKRDIESGRVNPVFLNGKYYGRYTIRDIEAEETHWHRGRPIIIKVSLSIREHVESIPVAAAMKMNESVLKRGNTGIGGPAKLAGMAGVEPTGVARALVPQINPITRMVG